MKNKIITLASAAILGLAFTTTNNVALAETVVKETTTTNTAGTISEFGTDTIIVRSETSPTPIRYSYSKTTTYVDEAGRPVSMETVKSGLPVTVYYSKDGDRMIATKVIVRTAAPANVPETQTKKVTTTTTNTAGTISEFGTDTIIVRSETSPTPIRYSYSKTTTYVDESGRPVSMETVKSGLPVTVYYSKDGDRMVATKVIVRNAAPANVPEVETKKTTTTTTTTNNAGTISEFGADTIVVRSETATAPLRYSYSKKTTYVNEAGEPVSIETVKSGLPVTVYYTKDGDKMIATKVIVRTAVVK